MKKTIAVLLLVALSGWFFHWDASNLARQSHATVRDSLVRHPEFIPDAQYVKLVASGFEPLVSDLYWLASIQYIGSNVMEAEYKKYLYQMLNLVTDLDEYFDYPYELGLLLLPSFNTRYESFTEGERKFNVDQAAELGEKGMRRGCDAMKLRMILDEEDLDKVIRSPEFAEPCRNPMIPYYLGYVEYWNRKDAKAASDYYKIAAAHKSAPRGARMMSAIMRGKSGDRHKAVLMFLSLAETLAAEQGGKKGAQCSQFVSEFRNLLVSYFGKGEPLTANFVWAVEQARQKMAADLGETDTEDTSDAHMRCSTYVNKATRELNIRYVEERDAVYVEKTGKTVKDAKELFDAGAIEYLPKDPQILDAKKNTAIIYTKKNGGWDYEGGTYGE